MQITVSKNLKSIYENYHESGESEWRKVAAKDKVEHILELCRRIKHEIIIEVGSGDGAVLARLDAAGFANQICAIDVAKSAVEVVERRNLSSLAECKVFDGYSIPYEDKRFDLAILTHVLEHVEHPRILLQETRRIAKYTFIEVPLEYNVHGIRYCDQSLKYGHINYYNPFLINSLLKNMGFEIIDTCIFNPSLHIYRFQSGMKGIAKYLIKQILLKVWPGLATKLIPYIYVILCK